LFTTILIESARSFAGTFWPARFQPVERRGVICKAAQIAPDMLQTETVTIPTGMMVWRLVCPDPRAVTQRYVKTISVDFPHGNRDVPGRAAL
jgi:hypothetical protein